MKILVTAILILISQVVGFSQRIIHVEGNKYHNLGKDIGLWCDTSRTASVGDLGRLPDTVFHPSAYPIFNGQTKGDVWWAKVRYIPGPDMKTYLVIDYANIDSLDVFYRSSSGAFQHIQSGSFLPAASRVFPSSEYIFALPDVDGAVKEVYIRITTVNTLVLPLKLVDGLTLTQGLNNKYMFQFLQIGITFSLFLFNLFMLVTTKDRAYGYYLARIFFLYYVFVIAYLGGFGHFLGDDLKKFITVHGYMFAAAGFIFTIIFNNEFLKVKRHFPKAMPVMNVLIICWVINIILSICGFRALTNKMMQVLIILSSVIVLFTSIRIINIVGYRRKYPLITFYIIGWLPISLAIFYIVPAMMGFFPLGDYSFNILGIAAVLEGICITLALTGDRFRLLRDGKKRAEEINVRLVQQRNDYLEAKIKERTQRLEHTVNALESSNEVKNKLFSIIAHDLRSPLSSLSAVLQLGDEYPVTGEFLQSMLKEIRKDTEQVQKTMDNLLNWAMIQMNLHAYMPETIPLQDFLEEHWRIYEALARKKEISCSISSREDIRIWADRNQLSLIVRNFIDNAVKFSPPGGVIEIGVDENDVQPVLYVANSGPGISEEMISRILSEEQIIGTSYGTANEKGTGLGLQLCKEFIRNMNSELKLNASANGKTRFSFAISTVDELVQTTPVDVEEDEAG